MNHNIEDYSRKYSIAVMSSMNNDSYESFVKRTLPTSLQITFPFVGEFVSRSVPLANYFFYSNINFSLDQIYQGLQNAVNPQLFDYIYLVYDATDINSYIKLTDAFNNLVLQLSQNDKANIKKVILVGFVTNNECFDYTQLSENRTSPEEFAKSSGFMVHTIMQSQIANSDDLLRYIECNANLDKTINIETDANCKAALIAIKQKLSDVILNQNKSAAQQDLANWVKSGEYKTHLSTLQGKSYYNSIYNMLCTFFSWFNPWSSSLYYSSNEQLRGNKNLFWDESLKQVAEVTVNMVARSLSCD